jgi:integrase
MVYRLALTGRLPTDFMRKELTPAFVAKPPLPQKGDREIYWDAQQPGLGLVVTESGHKSWCVQYRNRAGKTRRMAPPAPGNLSLDKARAWAKRTIGAVMDGRDPLDEERKARSAASNTLKTIAEKFLEIEGKRLRSVDERRKLLERHVYPALGDKPIAQIQKSDIVSLLDRLRENTGERTASLTYAYLSKVLRWHEMRDNDFRAPLARGMGGKASEPRSRVLDDDELRRIWKAADDVGPPFGTLVQFVLVTACRRHEASGLMRAELGIDLGKYDSSVSGTGWLIPAKRVKNGKDFLIPLSARAQALLEGLPNLGPAVFSHNGAQPLTWVSGPLAKLLAASETSGWSLHDLRRTARTLMSRAAVNPDHAERALNHEIRGIRKTYDWHAFIREKQLAFEALAAQIDRIVYPAENVVGFPAAAIPVPDRQTG